MWRWSVYTSIIHTPTPPPPPEQDDTRTTLDDENVPRPQQLPISEQWTGNVRETAVVATTFMHGDTLYTGGGTFRIREPRIKKYIYYMEKKRIKTLLYTISEKTIIIIIIIPLHASWHHHRRRSHRSPRIRIHSIILKICGQPIMLLYCRNVLIFITILKSENVFTATP